MLLCVHEDFDSIAFRSHFSVIGHLIQDLGDGEQVHIEAMGLTHLCDLPNIRVNHSLLGALVEHFHSKMNTFHLPPGEVTVTPEDIYRILRIPFHGMRVEYDRRPQACIAALWDIFQDELLMGRAISWDDMITQYGRSHRLVVVLGCFLSCFLMLDRGQHGLECD